jgi:hypothetical protein
MPSSGLAVPSARGRRWSHFGEEIDLLIRLGGLLIVGEVKCLVTPADSHERFNYFNKLRKASRQALDKAALLHKRPDIAARALGISGETVKALRFVPLVVTNQGFGFSLVIDGCCVTEAAFLLRYLGCGELVIGMAVDPRTGRQVHGETHLYATGQEAAERFEAAMEDPVVLRGFIKRIRWGKSAFPTAFGPAFSIEVPVLEDFYGEERWQAQLLASLLQLA